MSSGTIFAIEEFSIYDGPGLRICVFFKGCPLRCEWCHNPEGQSCRREIVHRPNGCISCGACKKVCPSPHRCTLCGRCLSVCPNNLIRISGEVWSSEELVRKLEGYKEFFGEEGGVTFSGGEPLAQAEFLMDVLYGLRGVNRAIESSGYADPDDFRRAADECDLVMMDLKSMNDEIHKKYTGLSNKPILQNLQYLKKCGKPFVIRIPLIPGVNDTEEHFSAVAGELAGVKDRCRVEILPYNKMAGAKYAMIGREYKVSFPAERDPELPAGVLEEAGIKWKVL